MGLVIQLGPHGGGPCGTPHLAHQDFCAIDVHGMHPLSVQFCGCDLAQTHRQQLLHVGWFPATVHDPRTICTFNLLHHFHLQTLQSKITAYDFYGALAWETDNTGLHTPKVGPFLRVDHDDNV